MANNFAPYKQEHILGSLQDWWDQATTVRAFNTIDSMFTSFVTDRLKEGDLASIVSRNDFQRCLYKLGIMRLGDGDDTRYAQMDSWRPSDNAVMRFPLYVKN